MNIEYLKYALEIANTKSINKASENLFISQPNLSRMMKKLEEEVGIKIFSRTQTGIEVTIAGNEFLSHASTIVEELESIKSINATTGESQKFSISVPKASYISRAFMSFVSKLDQNKDLLIDYKESSSIGAIDNILLNSFNLGIIRYEDDLEPYFQVLLKERGLIKREICKFNLYVAFSKNDPLANKECLTTNDFNDYIEISHGQSYIPYMSRVELGSDYFKTNKKIRVYDSMGQLQMLRTIPKSFMLVFPLDEETMEKYGLVQRTLRDFCKVSHDVLILRKNYVLTTLDRKFLDELENNIRR